MPDLKRVGRYLDSHRCLVNVFKRCGRPLRSRRSVTGVATVLDGHCIRTQRNLQSTDSLSLGEAEYLGIVKAMALRFMVRSLLADFGIEVAHWSEDL
eukprot:4297619-Amphidinium_carterae.1